jgi:TRAP-type uncharacterized transport system substrate-binding protein
MNKNDVTLKPTRLRTHPHTTRSRLMLEVASQLVNRKDFPYLQARISLREQGAGEWPVTLFASDSPATIEEVADGRVQFGIINPSMILKLAALGNAPFKAAIPLRVIAVLPSLDAMLFAVKDETGLKSFREIRARKFPLRVSLRAQPDHSLHVIVNHVLEAAGFSLEDIVSWGGQVRYDAGMAYGANRIGAMQRGEIDAIFDEGASAWGNMALELGMNFLSLDESMLERLESLGLRRGLIQQKYFPKLAADVPTLDFSGWPIYTHRDTPDVMVADFCRALEESKERIPWAQQAPLPLAQMVRDTPEGHLEVPLHPAAERFWREHGYLA